MLGVTITAPKASGYGEAMEWHRKGHPLLSRHAKAVAMVWQTKAPGGAIAALSRGITVSVPAVLEEVRQARLACTVEIDRAILMALADYVLDHRETYA